jgi:hypothetical protein
MTRIKIESKLERQQFEWIRRTEFDRNWPVMFGSVARWKLMTKFTRRFLSLFRKSLGLDRRFATRTTRKPQRDSLSLLTCSITYLRVNGFTYSKRLSVIWRTVYTNICDTQYTKKKKELHGLSLRANYTDRATVPCRRSDCQLLCGERVQRGQRDGSLRPYSRFLTIQPCTSPITIQS